MSKVYYLMHSQDNIRGATDYKDMVVPSSSTIVMDLCTGKLVEHAVSIYDCENAVIRDEHLSGTVVYELYEYTEKQYIIDYSDDCMLVLKGKTIIVWFKGHMYTNDFIRNGGSGYILLGGITEDIGCDSVHRNSVVHYENGTLYGYNEYCTRKKIVFINKGEKMSKSQFKRKVLLCT